MADGPGSCGFEGPEVMKLEVSRSATSFQNPVEKVGGSMINGASSTSIGCAGTSSIGGAGVSSIGGAGVSSIGGAGVSSMVGESDEGPEIGNAGSTGA